MKYSTVFRWTSPNTLKVYYRYPTIGLIPTDISFIRRKRTYSTIQIMNLLANHRQKSKHLKSTFPEPFTVQYWETDLQRKFATLHEILSHL